MLTYMSRLPRSYTRRSFLGRAAAAAAIPGAVAVAAKVAGDSSAPARAATGHEVRRFRKIAENALHGDPAWDVRHLGAPDAIMGYAGRDSVLAGESVPLFVSTTARSFRVRAYRTGWYRGDLARLVWESGSVHGSRQGRAQRRHPTNTITADWGPSLTVPTHDWPAGSYLLRLDAESGEQRFVPLTIRSASTTGQLVIKNSVATWQAYNLWGGYDLYNGPGGLADYDNRSLAVSLDRPYDHEGAYLFLIYERKLIELAERLGLPLAYVSSTDIAADPALLTGASALISLGHDEYWSPPERANVTAARDSGVNIAFLGANAMFRRTRLASTKLGPRREVVCYKTSYLQDPMYGRDNALVTSDWREPPHPDPESSLTGTLYESNPTTADFVVYSPDAWIFEGTGVRRGTRFPGLVGTEYDRVNPDSAIERPIEIMSHSPLTCRGVNSYSDSAYYTHRGGAGVFNSGTMRWVESFGGYHHFGLDARTARFTKRVTANVLRAFADGPAAAKYPARDNLRKVHEWSGDPVGTQHSLWG
jgi:hypothetical protein